MGKRKGRGQSGKYPFERLQKTLPLHSALGTVARSVGRREERTVTPCQVALNWVVTKGAVPLAGVNSPRDAREVAGCVGWRLKAADLEALDAAVAECKATKAKTELLMY